MPTAALIKDRKAHVGVKLKAIHGVEEAMFYRIVKHALKQGWKLEELEYEFNGVKKDIPKEFLENEIAYATSS